MGNPISLLFSLAASKKVSGTELARRTGVTRSNISNLKQKADGVTLDKYVNLANALGYDVVLEDRENPDFRYKL